MTMNMPTNNGTDANTSPLQSNTEDNQIYEINIDQIYTDYVKSIDSKRSYVNIIGQNTTQLLQAIGGNPEAPTGNNLVPAKTYQESRCHAFFRIIGFPVVNNDMSKMYNPGHDIIYGARSIHLSDKIAIANNPIPGFNVLSNFREQYFLNNLKIFATPTTVDAGALSLSGGANKAGLRLFNSPFAVNQDSFDMSFVNQSYSADYTSIVGGGSYGDGGPGYVNLAQYQDASGNFPASATLPPNKLHIIKPFIVDPRFDFSCSPMTNRIGVPFVPNNTFLQISSGVDADPPLLEIVIRDRFTVNNQIVNTGDLTQEFATFIKTIANSPPDQSILGQINQNDVQQLATNTQFLQFVNIIQAMIKKLVAAQQNIAAAQSQYYWLPIPSTSGPEGGSTIQGVFLPNQTASQLVTNNDGQILISTAQSLFSQTNQNAQASAAQGQPDLGGFARSLKNSLGPGSSSAFENNSMNTLASLTARRQSILSAAGDALRTVEIIMGEFSGLGLCDMIAILGALYTMPQEDLLGFLDTDALARMNIEFNNNFPEVDIGVAMDSFCNTINEFYQLMEAVYGSEVNTQGLSV